MQSGCKFCDNPNCCDKKDWGECPVCFENVYDNQLRCCRCSKVVCIKCVEKLLMPSFNFKAKYQCPLCRNYCGCRPVRFELMAEGTWTKVKNKK